MAKIFLISEDSEKKEKLSAFFEKEGFQFLITNKPQNEIISEIAEFFPDIIFVDCEFQNAPNLTKIIKSSIGDDNIQLILILPPKEEINGIDYLNFSDGFLEDLDEKLLKGIIETHLKTKTNLDILSENNKDLSKSLYRLNALYNISSQFATTLNKEKLCHITLLGLEQILSYDIASILIFDEDRVANLYLKSNNDISESLQNGLQLRLLLNYKNMFNNINLPYEAIFDNINFTKEIKPSKRIYDLKALSFDSICIPIKVEDQFFGLIEVIREIPLSQEDILSCQTIIHQVALLLRNATLYEEIKKTNVKLEKLERIKTEFVSIVSHELRTPLTPINNSLDIVLSGSAGEISSDTKNFIQMAKRNVSRLSGIIEDLLDLSRIQTGKFDFRFKKTTVMETLKLIEQTFRGSAEEKNMEFSVEIEEEKNPELYIDPHRIEQVLSNLISNALKFTPEGGKISVTSDIVNIENENQNFITPKEKISDKYLKISVSDTGIGINQEDIEGIFNKFSQIESSLNRNKGGIGLGLTITKQLIDSHFGLVSVESEISKGSKFNVYLPVFDERNSFKIELEDALLKNDDLGLINIKTNSIEFLNYLKEKNILKRTNHSKELLIENGESIDYWLFTPQVKKQILDFIESAINSERRNNTQFEKCDILLKRADKKDKDKFNRLKGEL